MLNRLLDGTRQSSPTFGLWAFVDDASPYQEAESEEKLLGDMVPNVRKLAAGWRVLHLVPSTKSPVLASSSRIAHGLSCAGATVGTPLKRAQVAANPGLDLGTQARRLVPWAKRRGEQAAIQANEGLKLHFHQARKIVWLTAVKPQALYGDQASGLSPSACRRLRGSLVLQLGAKPGWCTSTPLELEPKVQDPKLAVPLMHAMQYISLWLSEPSLRHRAQASWRFHLQRVKKLGAVRWRAATGPVSSLICAFMGLGWTPSSATEWVDPEGAGAYGTGPLMRRPSRKISGRAAAGLSGGRPQGTGMVRELRMEWTSRLARP